MRKLLLVLGIILTLSVGAVLPASATENGKTAVVDFTVVINESDAGQKANAELAEFIKDKQAIAEEKGENVQNIKNAFKEQVATLSAEDKKAKEEEFNQAFRDYQAAVAEFNAEVQTKKVELRDSILKEIKEVLSKIAQEENYYMIFDTAVVPYYDKNTDISGKVIRKYNEVNKRK